MLFPVKNGIGIGALGSPAGIDAEFVDAFRRWEQLQAAAASGSSASALTSSAARSSKGFADGLSAWLNPQLAVQEISAGFRNLGGTNVSYFAGLLTVPVAVVFAFRRR